MRGAGYENRYGSDHAGFSLKREIARVLKGQGHEIEDFGAYSEDAVDLSDQVCPAALAVGEGRAERGIFVDGVGYGSALIANRIYGVYAAVCQDPFCAGLARSHSDTNVLCIGGKIIGSATRPRGGEDLDEHGISRRRGEVQRRVDKVREISRRHLKPLPVE